MHSAWAGRLVMALAEVQEVVVASAGRLKRMTQRRIVWLRRRSPDTEQDPVLAMLASAPVDDEPITDDDRQHMDEGWMAYHSGQAMSAEDVKQACLDAAGDADRKAADRTVTV